MSTGAARPVHYNQGRLEVAGDPRRVFGVVAYPFSVADASSGGAVIELVPPAANLVGRIAGVSTVVTTAVVDTADVIQIGDGTDADEYGTHTVAVGAEGTKNFGLTAGDDALIDAGGRVEVTNSGGATSGAYSGVLYVEWFDPAH